MPIGSRDSLPPELRAQQLAIADSLSAFFSGGGNDLLAGLVQNLATTEGAFTSDLFADVPTNAAGKGLEGLFADDSFLGVVRGKHPAMSALEAGATHLDEAVDASDGLNCYERCLEAAETGDLVVLFDDVRPGREGDTEHAAIGRYVDGELMIFDPPESDHGVRLSQYLEAHPEYRFLASGKAKVFQLLSKGAIDWEEAAELAGWDPDLTESLRGREFRDTPVSAATAVEVETVGEPPVEEVDNESFIAFFEELFADFPSGKLDMSEIEELIEAAVPDMLTEAEAQELTASLDALVFLAEGFTGPGQIENWAGVDKTDIGKILQLLESYSLDELTAMAEEDPLFQTFLDGTDKPVFDPKKAMIWNAFFGSWQNRETRKTQDEVDEAQLLSELVSSGAIDPETAALSVPGMGMNVAASFGISLLRGQVERARDNIQAQLAEEQKNEASDEGA